MGHSRCAADGCQKDAANAKLCWAHYARLRKHGSLEATRFGTCGRCGTVFDCTARTGPIPPFCGTECADADRLRVGSRCVGCHGEITGRAGRRVKYCSPNCRSLVKAGRARPREIECVSCGAIVDMTRRTSSSALWYRANTARCDACSAARRPRRYPLTAQEIAERDGPECRWCHTTIDMSLRDGSRLSPSVDHIIPWSRGGPNDADNLQLLHRVCNAEKGVRMPA